MCRPPDHSLKGQLMATRKPSALPKAIAGSFAERDGRELAVTMLHDLQNCDGATSSIEAEYRPAGTRQSNVVLRYLDTLRQINSRELDAGFSAILTDFIGTTLCGCVPDPEFYEDLLNGDVKAGA
jgi:hypothetical protein